MSRGMGAFLRQVADELPGHLPPALRDYEAQQWGRFYKVWYGDRKIHFEVQFLSRRELQIGLHLEADEETNERVAVGLERRKGRIRKALGEEASVGSHGPRWRCMAESWRGGELTGEDAAIEAAARLAEYMRTLQPLLSQKDLASSRSRG
jgi:hypothetical protein